MLGRHHAIGSAVGLARDYRDLWDRVFGKRVQQFRALADDSAVFMLRPGKETGNVFKRDQGNVEAVAETDEARAFDRSIDIEHTRKERRLVGDDSHRPSI